MYTQSRIGTAWRNLLLMLSMFFMGAALAASEDIILTVEEPLNGDTYSGVANIRGWALSPLGMSRIELYVDGEFKTNIPLGGRRRDVEDAYPGIPGAGASGFSMAFNYSELSRGSHTLTIRAVESTDASRDAAVTFNVVRFDNPFVRNASNVSLNGALCTISGDQVFLDNVGVEGKSYDLDLGWRTASQDFAVQAIAEGQARAQWRAETEACCNNGNFILTVTIDGVTRSSSVASCQSQPVVEGFVATAAGSKSISAVAAGLCGSANFSGNFTFNAGECYRLKIEFDASDGEFKLRQVPVGCNEPQNRANAQHEPQAIDVLSPQPPPGD